MRERGRDRGGGRRDTGGERGWKVEEEDGPLLSPDQARQQTDSQPLFSTFPHTCNKTRLY